MLQSIEYIGKENLEDIAEELHLPAPGVYVYVNLDGTIERIIRNRDKVEFNSKLKAMDYYSSLVSMQKPIKSKLIFSNNYLSFFCRDVEKIKDSEIDEYFVQLETPGKYNSFKNIIKNKIHTIEKDKLEVVKFFLLEKAEKYRELGLENWREKAISQSMTPAKFKGTGFPIGCVYNYKKPFQASKMFLVDKDEGLFIKFFYDILKGLCYRGYNMLIVGENKFIPLRNGELPSWEVSGKLLAFSLKKGQPVITHLDTVDFKPWL